MVFGKVCSWGSKQIFAGISEKSQIRRDGLVEVFYDVAEVEYLGMVGLMSSYYIPQGLTLDLQKCKCMTYVGLCLYLNRHLR